MVNMSAGYLLPGWSGAAKRAKNLRAATKICVILKLYYFSSIQNFVFPYILEALMPDEKFDEKEREKREEKSAEEKYRRDPLSAVVWAIILVWAGLVLLASNLGMFDRLFGQGGFETGPFFLRLESWSIILMGAGVIVLGEALVRYLVPEYRRPVGGTIFFGLLLIAFGLGNLISWNLVWPVILIGLGISVLLRGSRRRE
jgi:hypothetical protein